MIMAPASCGRSMGHPLPELFASCSIAILAMFAHHAGAVGVMKNGRVVGDHSTVDSLVEAAAEALVTHEPRGPHGPAAAHVFAFADHFNPMLCHLARSVEAAGGWLHVLGLRDGRDSRLPWGDVEPSGSKTRQDEPWHFEDKSVMMKKHVFLARAIRELPANSTVIFVDAFDVLFQRPLTELVAAYRRLAGPVAAAAGGQWPVVYGGEVNCWPFPHHGRLPVRCGGSLPWIHEIPGDASLSAGHHGRWRFAYGDRSPWSIRGDALCGEWLSRACARGVRATGGGGGGNGSGIGAERFPFLCAGTFMGTASALRRVLRRLFTLYQETREFHDQALLQLLLLRNDTLGFVDTSAQLFLGLHGHNELNDLERPLCRGTHFSRQGSAAPASGPGRRGAAAAGGGGGVPPRPPVPGYRAPPRSLEGLTPPGLAGAAGRAPAVLHFNGNGKRHLMRCVEEFRAEGVLGGRDEGSSECTFLDQDRRAWHRYR